jgi:hypothetical protein
VDGVAALLNALGLAEHLPACLEHEMDLGARHSGLTVTPPKLVTPPKSDIQTIERR